MYRAWQAGVSRFFWYTLRDQDPQGRPWNETAQSGLYFRGPTVEADRAKPILQAFRFPFVVFPRNKGSKRGINVWGRTSTSRSGWVVMQRKQGNGWKRLGRKRANANGLFKGFLRVRSGSNRSGKIRAVFRSEASIPFPLKRPGDRPAKPFG